MKLKRLGLMLMGVILATGCMDTNDHFVLNPDGSGKVIHEIEFEPINLSMGSEESERDSKAQLKNAIKDELEKAKGITVWKDVSFEKRQGRRVYFKGTAYFKDINKIKFHNSGTNFGLYNQVSFKKDKDELILQISDGSDSDKEKKTPKALTDAEIDEKIQKNKDDFNSKKMLLAGMLGGLKVKRTFELPGAITNSTNFKKSDNNIFEFEFQGTQLLEIFETMMNDEE